MSDSESGASKYGILSGTPGIIMIQILLLCGGIIVTPLLLEKIFGKPHGSLIPLWLAAAICFVTIIVTGQYDRENRLANFAEHFFGGGVPAGLAFIYLSRHFTKLTWFQEVILLFFFVSGLGALNELLEFLLDQTTSKAYSIDRWDTWYDILANSLGALFVWIAYRALFKSSSATLTEK